LLNAHSTRQFFLRERGGDSMLSDIQANNSADIHARMRSHARIAGYIL
jgi:hypothetical protein